MANKTIAFRIPAELREAVMARAGGQDLSVYLRDVLARDVAAPEPIPAPPNPNGGPVGCIIPVTRVLLAQATLRAELNRLSTANVPPEVLVERYLAALVEHDKGRLKQELNARRNI
ncbi:MAG: hypothetical protein Q8R28_14935 [Dehalococcoidia bacterium]|nr:hypothetical protein [Dehalococcoidia bacterium]